MLDRIIDRYHLVGKDTAAIVEYLGTPNEIIDIDDELQYKYFLGVECIGQNPENAAGGHGFICSSIISLNLLANQMQYVLNNPVL